MGVLEVLSGLAKVGGAGAQGYGIDRDKRAKNVLAQESAAREAERNRVLNALTQAQIGQAERETALLGAVRPKEPPQVLSPGQGVRNEAGGYDVPIPAVDRPAGNIDPLSAPGISAAASRAGEVAKAEAPFKTPPTPQQPTEFERKGAFVYPKAEAAAKVLDEFFDKGAPLQSSASKIPVVGNYFVPADQQRMLQAAKVVSAAILRLESGATITPAEIEQNAGQMMPQPGDTPEVLAQKRQTLRSAVQSLKDASVRARPSASGAASPAPSVGKTLSPDDAMKAKADPGFAAWLRTQGYEIP